MLHRVPLLAILLLTSALPLPLQAGGPQPDAEEAAKALLRPVCANPAEREKIVAAMIKAGGEYEKATAKWDMDLACEQIDLPVKPIHDTADPALDATHTDWIYDARWAPDGRTIVTAGRDGTVRLWDVESGKTKRVIDLRKRTEAADTSKKPVDIDKIGEPKQAPMARAARFLDGNKYIVVTADGQPVHIFDTGTGDKIAEIPYSGYEPIWPPNIKVTPGGLVVIGGYSGATVVYDTKTKAERFRLPAVRDEYPQFAVSEEAGLLALATRGAERSVMLLVFDLASGKILWQAEAEGDPSADDLAFSRDSKQLAVAVRGVAYVFGMAEKKLLHKVQVYPSFGSFDVAFTADGKGLISGQRHAILWDIASGKRLHHFGPFSDLCHSLDISPDGKYLLTSHLGSDARIWEIATGTFVRRLGKDVKPPR